MDKLINLFTEFGENDYIGEEVTQLEHALQASQIARDAGETRAMVMAALCHDIGHLLIHTGYPVSTMDGGLGAQDHDWAGATWLSHKMGLKEDVTEPVRLHVAAKRYEAFKSPDYISKFLSEASQQTLKYQGGPMTRREADEFEQNPYFGAALRLRQYDNAAKVKGLKTWTLKEAIAFGLGGETTDSTVLS